MSDNGLESSGPELSSVIMYFMQKDWRGKTTNMFDPSRFSSGNYYTDAMRKQEMKHCLGGELPYNLHLHPDLLEKNLADSVFPSDTIKKKNMLNIPLETDTLRFGETNRINDSFVAEKLPQSPPPTMMPSFRIIGRFFSSVIDVITNAVTRRDPHDDYFDCNDGQGAPPSWQPSNDEDLNKSAPESKTDMNDCWAAVAQCEGKLNKLHNRHQYPLKPSTTKPSWRSRPKKQFVEPGSVEEKFEDAFAPEDFQLLHISDAVECSSPFQIQKQELCETAASKIKMEKCIESMDIVKTVPEVTVTIDNKNEDNNKTGLTDDKNKDNDSFKTTDAKEIKTETQELNEDVVSKCEAKIKALLESCRKNKKPLMAPSEQETEVKHNDNHRHKVHSKTKDKHYKNPNRTTDKRRKTKLKCNIQDDLDFASELHSEEVSSADNSPVIRTPLYKKCPIYNIRTSQPGSDISSVENSPKTKPDLYKKCLNQNNSLSPNTDYFDEVAGRFRKNSATESEDSFQIVFTDSPQRTRQQSECSDDFIIFDEESPDSCYTSNDVFDDSDDESVFTESESELSDTEDTPPASKLSHMYRTCSDLTDDSLYDDQVLDEVDCAVQSVCVPTEVRVEEPLVSGSGILLNDVKKRHKSSQPPKSVQFSTQPPKVHVMYVWKFAARQARAGHWERCVIDRDRFRRRIADVDLAISWVLKPQHRTRVKFQRFQPWWRKQDLAEKKAKEEEMARQKAEEEKQRALEEEKKAEEDRLKALEEKREEEQQNIVNGNVNNEINNKDVNLHDTNNVNVINDNVAIINNENVISLNKINTGIIEFKDVVKESMQIVPVNEKFTDLRLQLTMGPLASTSASK